MYTHTSHLYTSAVTDCERLPVSIARMIAASSRVMTTGDSWPQPSSGGPAESLLASFSEDTAPSRISTKSETCSAWNKIEHVVDYTDHTNCMWLITLIT